MNAERARNYLLSLPHVLEAAQFGGIIFWLGDKAIGGKMFCMINPDAVGGTGTHADMPISYPAGAERFAELVEREGLLPAPYLARVHWVAATRWDALRDREWEAELTAAHALTLAKLPPKTRAVLALPREHQQRLIAERRDLLAKKAASKQSSGRTRKSAAG